MNYSDLSTKTRFQPLVRWHVFCLVIILLVVRSTGSFNQWFFEGDELSLATGTAALVRDNIGALYRYTTQLGYYRIVEVLDRLAGGDILLIPFIMRALAIVAGTLIPVLGLFVFQERLSPSVRWLTSLVLAANPILWKSSQYGNTALVAASVATLSLVVLSNRPGPAFEFLSLTLFCIAVLIRVDSILLFPILAVLLLNNRRSLLKAAILSLIVGTALLNIYLILFAFDSRIDGVFSAVSQHFGIFRESLFWEYLLWAVSPLPLIFAVLGFRTLLDKQPFLFLAVVLWTIPPMAFYFLSTTTPRYFVLVVFPLSIASAVGMNDIAERIGTFVERRFAWSIIIITGFAHLFVGLGHTFPGWRSHMFFAPIIKTDDAEMPTGALIYDTHFRNGFLSGSFRHPGFGKPSEINPNRIAALFREAYEILNDSNRTPRTTIILLTGPMNYAFHFETQARGAKYLSRAKTEPSYPYTSETWLQIGPSRVMTISISHIYYSALKKFQVQAGDEIWVMGEKEFPDQRDLLKLPGGLVLVSSKTFNKAMRAFQVRKASND